MDRPVLCTTALHNITGEVHDGNHIKTFDGFDYDFRAEGDFWLYSASKLKLQGRLNRQQNGMVVTEYNNEIKVYLFYTHTCMHMHAHTHTHTQSMI